MAYAEIGPIINGETTIVMEFHGGSVWFFILFCVLVLKDQDG